MGESERETQTPDWYVPAETQVLVAEDDVVSSTLLSYVLRAHGCAIDVATSGEEAIERVESKAYTVAFLDLLLPGMTGLEASHHLRSYPRNEKQQPLRIVGMSTLPLGEVWKSCSAAGMDAFLAKPIQKDDVVRVLQHIFAGAQDPGDRLRATSVIDLPGLLQRIGGDLPFVRDLAAGFLARCPAMLVEVRDALWRADREQLALSVHRLAGSAAEFGAHRVLAMTHEVERISLHGDLRQIQKLVSGLEEAVAQMQGALRSIRDRGTV